MLVLYMYNPETEGVDWRGLERGDVQRNPVVRRRRQRRHRHLLLLHCALRLRQLCVTNWLPASAPRNQLINRRPLLTSQLHYD